MQPSTRDTAKGFVAVIAATVFVIAVILSAPAYARHGGNGSASIGNRSSTPTYDAWLAQSEAAEAPARQEASLNSVMTDASEAAKSDGVKTLTPDYDHLSHSSR